MGTSEQDNVTLQVLTHSLRHPVEYLHTYCRLRSIKMSHFSVEAGEAPSLHWCIHTITSEKRETYCCRLSGEEHRWISRKISDLRLMTNPPVRRTPE